MPQPTDLLFTIVIAMLIIIFKYSSIYEFTMDYTLLVLCTSNHINVLCILNHINVHVFMQYYQYVYNKVHWNASLRFPLSKFSKAVQELGEYQKIGCEIVANVYTIGRYNKSFINLIWSAPSLIHVTVKMCSCPRLKVFQRHAVSSVFISWTVKNMLICFILMFVMNEKSVDFVLKMEYWTRFDIS